MKYAPIGSISHATLRPEDLIEAFGSELEWQIQRNGAFLSLPENFPLRDRLASLLGEWQDAWDDKGELIDDYPEDLIDDLSSALNEFSPPYCYFGAHEGDGSDFGYWPSMYEILGLPTVADSDEAMELGEDCKSVNDHGNVTVHSGDGEIVLELV